MEKWKPVPDYEGLYEVSNLGRIRSVERTVFRKDGTTLHYKGKILHPYIGKKGYPVIGLSKNGRAKTYQLHRIVAKCFIPAEEEKDFINHKDGDKANCAAENLEWVTSSENVLHAYRVLCRRPPRLGACGTNFTPDEVRAIRNDDRSVKVIADEYNTSRENIYNIKKRKTYAIIPD